MMHFKPRKKTSRRRRSTKRRFETLEDRQLLTTYTGTGGAIVDNTTTNFTLDVADSVQIADVDAQLNIQHSRDADLDVFLVAPDGTRVELFTDVGGNGDDFAATTLDDEAGTAITSGSAPFSGSFRPEGSLADFDGKDSAGTWTLEIDDDRRRQSGQIIDWSLTIQSGGPPTISISDATVVEGAKSFVYIDDIVAPASGGLASPRGMAYGPDGELYVASFATNDVLRYDGATGAFIDAFVADGSGGLSQPWDLTFHDGDLYVVSRGTDEVLRYNGGTGAFVDEFVSAGAGGLSLPRGLLFGGNNDLYVTSTSDEVRGIDAVLRFDATTGDYIDEFIPDGDHGLDNPSEIAIGPDSNFYVTGTGINSNAVLRYDSSGNFIDEFASAGEGGLDRPFAMQFLDDKVLVSSLESFEVLTFDLTTGDFVDNAIPAGLDGLVPGDLLFDDSGNLLVATADANSVRRYQSVQHAVLDIQLSSAATSPVTVDFATADGTAIGGSDYVATSGSVIFNLGESSKQISVPILDDSVQELDEQFQVTLSNASGASIADGTAVGTILDDDAPANPNTIYVSDISFESKRRGRDWRAVFEVRDQDNNPLSGVQIEVTFAGDTYTGTTDSNGIFGTSWIRNLSSGNHYAEAADLAFANHDWDQDLGWSEDYDGDGLPDALLEN